MVSVLEVIYSVVKAFKECMPTSKHYIGNLTENYVAPCFVHRLVFNNDKRQTKHVKDTTIDLQIIYFGTRTGYANTDYEDTLKVMDSLKSFLDTFLLEIGDRNLKFDYRFSEADGQLTVNMDFKFKDGVIDMKFNEEQARDMIGKISLTDKEMMKWDFPIS